MNLLEVFKLWVAHDGEQRGKAIEWLECTVKDAEELIDIWEQVMKSLPEGFDPPTRAQMSRASDSATMNVAPYHRLMSAYRYEEWATPEDRDIFHMALGTILENRRMTFDAYGKIIDQFKDLELNRRAADGVDRTKLQLSLYELKKSVSELKQFARNYKHLH